MWLSLRGKYFCVKKEIMKSNQKEMERSSKLVFLIRKIVEAFGTNVPTANYDQVEVYDEGPGREQVLSYGRMRATELFGLRQLIERYSALNGIYSKELGAYVPKIGNDELWRDEPFIEYLRKAGQEDSVMRKLQDEFFDMQFLMPAFRWADRNGFTLPLSLLVIGDSYIHSGGISGTILSQMRIHLPKDGGNEKKWVSSYIRLRRKWLDRSPVSSKENNQRRMDFMQEQIKKENWMLDDISRELEGIKIHD